MSNNKQSTKYSIISNLGRHLKRIDLPTAIIDMQLTTKEIEQARKVTAEQLKLLPLSHTLREMIIQYHKIQQNIKASSTYQHQLSQGYVQFHAALTRALDDHLSEDVSAMELTIIRSILCGKELAKVLYFLATNQQPDCDFTLARLFGVLVDTERDETQEDVQTTIAQEASERARLMSEVFGPVIEVAQGAIPAKYKRQQSKNTQQTKIPSGRTSDTPQRSSAPEPRHIAPIPRRYIARN